MSALQAENGMLKAENYSDKNAKEVYGKYLPMLKQVGIVDENNKVDIEVAKGFINSAFDKSGTVEYLGFKFDKSDGEALINIMEKYNDNAE